MKVNIQKLTDIDLARKACSFTLHSGGESKASLRKLYGSEHSPARTQLFWIELDGIPSFVSVHLVRHKVGVEHFIQTYREDRGGPSSSTREAPVRHAMLINAQALINMCRKRLCSNSHEVTRQVMIYIKNAVKNIDPDLAEFMVVECVYKGGWCFEPNCCGIAESYYD